MPVIACFGMTSTWTGASGRTSRNASARSVSRTIAAGICRSRIFWKTVDTPAPSASDRRPGLPHPGDVCRIGGGDIDLERDDLRHLVRVQRADPRGERVHAIRRHLDQQRGLVILAEPPVPLE